MLVGYIFWGQNLNICTPCFCMVFATPFFLAKHMISVMIILISTFGYYYYFALK